MLGTLQYRLSLPTVWCFMKRYTKAAGRQIVKPDSFFHLMSYLIELSMIQVQFSLYLVSTSHRVINGFIVLCVHVDVWITSTVHIRMKHLYCTVCIQLTQSTWGHLSVNIYMYDRRFECFDSSPPRL